MIYCKNCKWFKWVDYERHREPTCTKPIVEVKPWADYHITRRDASKVNRNGDCKDFEQKTKPDKKITLMSIKKYFLD